MQSEELATGAVEVLAGMLPAIVDSDVRAGTEAAVSHLYELVRQRLVMDGRPAAFDGFAMNPVNSSLVHDLLRQAIENDPAFADALVDAVDQARRAVPQSPSTTVNFHGRNRGPVNVAGRNIITNIAQGNARVGVQGVHHGSLYQGHVPGRPDAGEPEEEA